MTKLSWGNRGQKGDFMGYRYDKLAEAYEKYAEEHSDAPDVRQNQLRAKAYRLLAEFSEEELIEVWNTGVFSHIAKAYVYDVLEKTKQSVPTIRQAIREIDWGIQQENTQQIVEKYYSARKNAFFKKRENKKEKEEEMEF